MLNMNKAASMQSAAACTLVLAFSACQIRPTPIHELLNHTRDYEGKSVVIAGEVTDRTSMMITNYFVIRDDSGEIRVFTDRALPAVGEHLRIRGHAEQPLAIGSDALVVFREDSLKQQQ